MLKLGMVGAGFVANFHARALKQVRDVQITGVVSPHRAKLFSSTIQRMNLGPGKVYPNVEAMTREVDAIVLCVPNDRRVEIVESIVTSMSENGPLQSIICEKPLGRNMQEAHRMVELANQAGLKTAYFENQIFMKPIQTQRQQLAPQQKNMGPLSLVRSSEEHGGPHESWFWDPVRQGGGVLSDMGCHSIAAGWFTLTPVGKPIDFLQPVSVSADCALLKWGLPEWRERLFKERGVDYAKNPAEDYATGMVSYRNPDSGQVVKAQFTVSWMFEKQGLRLFMDGVGPGYAFEVNTLNSPVQIFIGDSAAEATANAEIALEKSTASRGLLSVQYNEADLYGYTDEYEDAIRAFIAGQDGFLPWSYGLQITRLVMAAYLSHERRQVIDLTDPAIQQELETYRPLIQQGRGRELLGD